MSELPPDRVGLVVVHGIGDPSDGEALRDLTDAMEATEIASFDASVKERRLGDVFARDEKLKFFPVHLRTGVLKGDIPQELIAAEVFWGSASQLAPGKWGVLQGTVSLLLNVPTLVMGAKGQSGALTTVSWWASMLLASAAVAINALLMLTLGTYIALCYVVGAPPGRWELAAPLVAAAVTLWLSRHSWLWFKEACLAFRLVPLCVVAWLFTDRTLQSFSTIGVTVLGIVIFVVAALVLVVGATFTIQFVAGKVSSAGITATLALCLQFGLWTLIVPLAWQGLFALVPKDGEQRWMLEAFGNAASSNGLQWVLAAIVLAAFGIVTVLRWWQALEADKRIHASENPQEAATSVKPADRLILHPIVATALFVCVVVGAAVVLLATVRPEWVAVFHALGRRVGNAKFAGAALLIVPLLSGQIRLALDLAYDVMFYLYYATEPGRRLLSRTRDSDRSNNPMRARFYAVVNHLVQEQKVTHLVILAHSQGTVIALR